MPENKNFSFKDWAKTKTTVEEHFIIEAEHLPVVNVKESTQKTEEQAENTTTEVDLRHSNLKYPKQSQHFDFPEHFMSGQYQPCGKNGLERILSLT